MSEDLQYAIAAKEAFANDSGKPAAAFNTLGPILLMEFDQAENDRRKTEQRWLQDLRQYKGQYDPEVLALIGPKRSKAFVRKTRVKVKTANSRVEDLLFPSGSEKNYEVDSTPVPSVSKEERAEIARKITAELIKAAQASAAQGQPPTQPPMATKEMVDAAVLKQCKEAAKGMAKAIDDQLTEVRYKDTCKKVFHSAHLYGTGILKGPLVERRIRSRFQKSGGKWGEKSEEYIVPFVDYVPLWRFYPDMGADSLENCRYVYERHQMTHAAVAELAERKSFRGTVLKEYLKSHPLGETSVKFIDNQLKIIGERDSKQGNNDGKYEILERWGYLTGEQLAQAGVKVDQSRMHESFFSNVWLLPNGEVIKAVLQPINGVTWPYHIYYFDKDETSIFGEGLAAVVRDDQTMTNAATRLMLDNGAVSSGPMLEVATGLLTNVDQNTEIEPWKLLFRNSQNPGVQAVRAIDLPSRLNELAGLADRFENNMDEVSAIPRYMGGENMTAGAGGTAQGLSMLMGASNIMVKDLVSNWDEGITRPFISALYRWNMQFNPDNSIKGDFDCKARGTASLVAREIRAQRLDMFAAAVANPMDAPFVKRDKLLRQRAEANELTDVIKTEEEVEAETNNEVAQQQQALQLKQATLTIEELTNKVKVLAANAEKIMAEVELTRAKTISTKVEGVYAALQAGGTATSSPAIAPAGDEILRSSGWVDATPTPTIAQLDSAPVQPAQPAQPQAVQTDGNHTDPMLPDPANVGRPAAAVANAAKPAGAGTGERAGIETPQV